MSSFLRIFFLSCLVLGVLNGCVSYGPPAQTVTQEAPPPQMPPAAAPPVQKTPAVQAPAAAPGAALPAGAKIRVAILLPLSGSYAALGQAMLNAAQLAVYDVADDHFELTPCDTGSGDAAAVAKKAIGDGARLIIGPVFAADVAAVKPVAASEDINMLALSTDTSLAEPGVYVMGFAPAAQVARVISYAHDHGLHRFAALIPENAYGDLVGDAFSNDVTNRGDVVTAFEKYDPAKIGDRARAIATLASLRGEIEALFLPEGGDELNAIAAQLAQNGFDNHKIRLLGTGLWDVDDLGPDAGFLSGGWYAGANPDARRQFVAAYRRSYGASPPRLVTLAYDATALAAVLVRHGGDFSRAALTNPNGFEGIDGIFRLKQDGIVERGLAVDAVTPGGGRMIDPAPMTFAGKNN